MTTSLTPSRIARTPEDLIALVPVVLGFEPERSIVMMTVGGRRPFHARLDLPRRAGLEDAVALLLAPVRRHRVEAVVFLLYTDRDGDARRFRRSAVRIFEGHGVRVADVLRVDGGRWFSLLGRPGVPVHGVPYDVSTHPFRVESVVDGEVLAASRAELAERLVTDPVGADAVDTALRDLVAAGEAEISGRELRRCLERWAHEDEPPDDATAARVLAALPDPGLRDAAWIGLTAPEAAGHVRLWCGLLRRAPHALVPGAAAVLAAVAWVAGQGALSWCAVDRSREAGGAHPLSELVAELLEAAVPPPLSWPGWLTELVEQGLSELTAEPEPQEPQEPQEPR